MNCVILKEDAGPHLVPSVLRKADCAFAEKNNLNICMCIYVHISVYTYIVYIYAYKQTNKQTNKQTYIHTYIHIYTHTCIHTYMYFPMCINIQHMHGIYIDEYIGSLSISDTGAMALQQQLNAEGRWPEPKSSHMLQLGLPQIWTSVRYPA